jgi:three-Cys-motif partner protein
VQTYIEVLTRNPRIDRLTLTLVDGFAGGMVYQRDKSSALHLGSPSILIDATSAAQAQVNAQRVKPVRLDARFVFVEKEPEVVSVLKRALDEHVLPHHPGVAPQILTGPFEDHVKAIIKDIKSVGRAHRAIILLDQYGYTAVPLPLLQEIFRELPNAEVFLTLATGWISGYLRNASEAATVLRDRMGIRSEASEEEIEEKLIGGKDDAQMRLRLVQQLLQEAL